MCEMEHEITTQIEASKAPPDPAIKITFRCDASLRERWDRAKMRGNFAKQCDMADHLLGIFEETEESSARKIAKWDMHTPWACKALPAECRLVRVRPVQLRCDASLRERWDRAMIRGNFAKHSDLAAHLLAIFEETYAYESSARKIAWDAQQLPCSSQTEAVLPELPSSPPPIISMAATASTGRNSLLSFYLRRPQLSVPEDQYQTPELPVQLPSFEFRRKAKFGTEMKEQHFFLDKTWTFLNHGAFGAAIKESFHAGVAWSVYCECQPTKFIDREVLMHIEHVTRRMAKFVDAEPCDVVLVPNASTGTSSFIQSLADTFKPGEAVFTLNVAYGTVKKQIAHYCVKRGIRVDESTVTFPVRSADEIVELVKDSLKPDTKLAVFDHIPSSEPIIMPVKQLVEVCHSRGIQVLIDGAHCLGSIPISMKEIGADYYVSNAHKWLCSAKGCAFLYVAKEYQHLIRPLVISHGYGAGFFYEHSWTGTDDLSGYLSLHTVLDFWEFYGVNDIRTYIHDTARAAGQLLVTAWGTSLLADPALFGPMVLVALPEGLPVRDTTDTSSVTPYTYTEAEALQNLLHHNFKIEVPIKVVQGKLCVRASAHVYNKLADYQVLADAVLSMQSKPTQQC